MSDDEGSKVRLVRCPKCQNLLSEPSDHSLYQCGGCRTVLQAKKKLAVNDELPEKYDDEKVIIEGTGNIESIAGENTVSKVNDIEIGSNVIDHGVKQRFVDSITEMGSNVIEHGVKQRFVDSNVSSSPITQNRELYRDVDRNRGRERVDTRFAQTIDDNNNIGYGNRQGRSLNQQVDQWVKGDGYNVNMDRPNYNSRDEKEPGEIMHLNGQGMDRDGRYEFYGNSNYIAERGRPSPFVYPNEGHFNYHQGYANDYMDGPQKVANSDHNRAEIRRKLDELKYQLSVSYDVVDNSKGKVHVDQRMSPMDDIYMSPPSTRGDTVTRSPYFNRNHGHGSYDVVDNSKGKVHVDQRMSPMDDIYMSPPSTRGDTVTHSPYFNRNHGHGPFVNKHDIDTWDYYSPSRYAPNDIPRYEDPLRPQMLQRPTHPSVYHYRSQSSYSNNSRGYLNTGHGLHDSCSHHLSCPCVQCNYRNKQVPPHSQGTYSGNRRFHEDSTRPDVYHDADIKPRNVGPRYHPKGVNTFPSHAQYPLPQERNPSDLDSEFGGISQYRPRKSVISHLNKRLCRPIAGGAPFLTCYNCLNLLKVPRKIRLKEKNNMKLQCGSCATILLFLGENGEFIGSNSTPNEPINAEINNGSDDVLNENLRDSPRKVQSMDNEANLPSNDGVLNMSNAENKQGLHYPPKEKESPDSVIVQNDISSLERSLKNQTMNIGDSETKQGLHYSSSISSDEKESPNSVIIQNDVSNLAGLSLNDNMPPTSLLVPRVSEILSNHVLSRFENGNRSNRTVKDVVASEIEEVSFNGFSSNGVSLVSNDVSKEDHLPKKGFSGVSQDSNEVIKDDHLPKNNKGSRSFFTNIKNSFRVGTLKRTSYISINGRPIPASIVSKAETLAGTIQPGEYWYDFRAGFWGVMGQPCSGIIPPFIEEFDYSMPKKCGAGNTGVYVNGRELNQRDLDLLVSRGLPTTKNKHYSVEISGKIFDEESGEELNSLGKLAPTVERTRKGFGMKVPQAEL